MLKNTMLPDSFIYYSLLFASEGYSFLKQNSSRLKPYGYFNNVVELFLDMRVCISAFLWKKSSNKYWQTLDEATAKRLLTVRGYSIAGHVSATQLNRFREDGALLKDCG